MWMGQECNLKKRQKWNFNTQPNVKLHVEEQKMKDCMQVGTSSQQDVVAKPQSLS